ncbi:MAG: DUF2304 domain-containing protein [Gemmatimonadota bacterium]
MIPIKLVLTLGLAVVVAYTLIQRVAPRALKIVIFTVVLLGIYFVWFPDHATIIANRLGVGRGTDLLIYVWIVLSFAIGLNLNFKIRAARHDITELARAIALMSTPDGRSGSPTGPSMESKSGAASSRQGDARAEEAGPGPSEGTVP